VNDDDAEAAWQHTVREKEEKARARAEALKAEAARARLREATKIRQEAEEEVRRHELTIRIAQSQYHSAVDGCRQLAAVLPRPDNFPQLQARYSREMAQALDRKNVAEAALPRSRDKLLFVEKLEAEARVAAAGLPPAAPPPKRITVYRLRDGSEIRAVSAASVDDRYLVRDENGKSHSLLKDDVEEIVRH
jgi:hypothetical protein